MHGGFLVPLFGALVIGLSGQNLFASIFAWKPIELLGQCSYCLFLLHFNFINLLRLYRIPDRLHLAAFDPWISYPAASLLAIATMHFVEKPARRAILGPHAPALTPSRRRSPNQLSPCVGLNHGRHDSPLVVIPQLVSAAAKRRAAEIRPLT